MKQRININLIPNGVAQVVHLSQNDYLNGELEFYLFHGSSVLSDGIANAMIKGLKPDNNIFLYNATSINGNVVTFNVTEQMTAVAGKVDCKLRIQTADGAKHSKAFILDCEADPTTDGNVSESVIDALEELIEQVTEDAAEAQAAAESANEDADRAEQAADDLSTFITRTGNPVIADKAEEKPLEKYVANIEPEQDLNGYDRPWAGGAGKNLSDPAKYVYGTTYGITRTNNGGGVVGVSGTATGSTTRVIGLSGADNEHSVLLKAGTTYFINGCWSGVTPATNTIRLDVRPTDAGGTVLFHENNAEGYTPTEDVYVRINLRIAAEYVVPNNVSCAPILTAEERAEAFEPYENICPISGYTGVMVTRTGKNLIDDSKRVSNSSMTTLTIGQTVGNGTPTIFLKAGTYTASVTFKNGATGAGNIRATDPNIGNKRIWEIGSTSGSFTLTQDANIAFYVSNPDGISTDDVATAQVEVGEVATDYEPYNGATYAVNFPTEAGTVYGGTLTVNSDGSGTLLVNRGYFDTTNLDGTESWYNPSVSAFSVQCLPNFAVASTDDGNETITNETNVSKYNYNKMRSKYPCICTRDNSKLIYMAISDSITSIEDAKAWLTAHPMQICYTLYTPVTYALSAAQVVQMLEGTNVVWNDVEGTQEVTYWHNSALNTLAQDIVDMQEAIDDMGDTIDDLSAEVVRKEDITQSGTVTTAGQYAVDARQLNPTISGTIAKRVTDLEDGVVLKSALSRSTSVASTKTAAVDAYELNASKSGTIAAKVKANTDALNSFKFGFTQDGKAGYIDPTSGADTVIPFKTGDSIEDIVFTDLLFTYEGGGSGVDMQRSVSGTIIAAGTVSITASIDYIQSETRSGWPSVSFSGSTVTLHHVHTFGTTVTATVRVWYLPSEE